MMYSFEGVVNLRPEQNLSGASKKEHRDALLKRTQHERQKRQEERRRNHSVLLIQSCLRSYLSRKSTKNRERLLFDEADKSCCNIQKLKPLLRQFIYFYDETCDRHRLVILCENVLCYESLILENIDRDRSLYFLIKKVLYLILNTLKYKVELEMLLNCIDRYTTSNELKKKARFWSYLVQNGYFRQLRSLLDSELHLEKVLSLIFQPLRFVNDTNSLDEVNDVFFEFSREFLCPDVTEAVKKKLLPYLISMNSFPYLKLMKYLKSNRNVEYTHNLLYFVLVLEPKDFVPTLDSVEVLAFLSVYLKNLSVTIDLTKEDSDDEDEKMEVCVEQLNITDFLQLLNNHDRVKKFSTFFDHRPDDEQLLWAFTQICHSLLLYSHLSITRHVLVYTLALRRKFLHQLWHTIELRQSKNTISQQLSSSASAWSSLETMIAVFCNMFILFSSVLIDRDAPASIEIFSNNVLCSICAVLKKLSLNLIDIAFPMCRTNQCKVSPQLLHLYKSSLSCVRVLHTLDLRKHFTPDGFWTKTKIHISPDLSKRNYLGTVLKPFQMVITKQTDEEMLPPLLTVEQRSLTILQELPFFVDFQSRLLMLRDLCKSAIYSMTNGLGFSHRDFSTDSAVIIRRTHLYEDAYEKLSPENEPNLRQKIRIQFVNNAGLDEPGIDGGGIFKEFICEVLKTAFDPNRGFFLLTNDNTLYPNPNVHLIVDNYASHYYFIGRMLGKALFENVLVDLPLADFFLEKLLSEKVDAYHLRSMDPVLYRNLLYVRDYQGDVQDLGLDFTVVCDDLGETRVVELKPNGSNIPVTNLNRFEYFLLLTDYKLNTQIKSQCAAFRNGLDSMIPLLWLKLFNHYELQVIIGGDIQEMDIADLRNHTAYGGEFNPDHPTILLFWKILESFSQTHKKQLLKFVTSCSRPPLLGFKELVPPFCIQSAGTEDRMPTASTCLNLLKLPIISKEDVLRRKLVQAIEQQSGFELS